MKIFSKKPYKLIVLSFLLLIVIGASFLATGQIGQAQTGDIFDPDNYLSETPLPTEDIRIIVLNFVRVGLGVVGIIFFIFILYGGFIWMTAAGSVEKESRARKIIINAVIGLIIMFMALAITTFVMNVLNEAVNGSGSSSRSCTEGEVSGCRVCTGGRFEFDPSFCELPGSSFRIRDISSAHVGADDTSNVYLCSSTQAQFNNNLDKSTVDGNIRLTQGSTSIPGSINLGSRSLEFVPNSKLLPDTSYVVHYSAALADSTGLFLSGCDPFGCSFSGGEHVWNFKTGTETDSDVPFITSASPVKDKTSSKYPDMNVSLDKIIRVDFSEAVRISTIDDGSGRPLGANIIIERLADQGVSLSPPDILDSQSFVIETRAKGFDLYLKSPELFNPFTWYRITVQGVEDLCGNIMNPAVWEFETNDRVPGVVNEYPKGNNICPDAEIISVSFATSMLYDQVDIMVTTGGFGNMPLYEGVIIPSLLEPGPYSVPGTGGVWSVDPNSDFKTFTFTLDDELDVETEYFVNINTDRQSNQSGETIGSSWSFVVSDSASCACAPVITSVNPGSGFNGQCVTVKGRCFLGVEPNNSTDPRHAEVTNLAFNDSVVLSGDIGSVGSNYLTTMIPGGFNVGTQLLPQLTITYNSSAFGSLSTNNSGVGFDITSTETAQGPCLLDVSPGKACFGAAESLTGIRFGDDPGVGARASSLEGVEFAGTLVPDPQVTGWTDSKISTLIPIGANDGDVMVVAGGLVSNGVPFNLACGIGSSCSGQIDQCIPDDGLCEEGLTCSEGCRCISSELPGTPYVINPFPTCGSSCVNVEIGAEFTQPMNSDSISQSSIEIRACGDTCDAGDLLVDITNSSQINYDTVSQAVSISPNGILGVGTDYRVIFNGSMAGEDSASLGGLNFDSDLNGVKDSYSWTFTTNDSECILDEVIISPVNTTADSLGQEIAYNSYALSNNVQCGEQRVNRWSIDWDWNTSNSDVGSISSSDLNSDGLIDPKQVATVTGEGVTVLEAEVDGVSADGLLTVDVIFCDESTDCSADGQCGGSICDQVTQTCTPVVNNLSPGVGPPDRWVTINGCYFGSRQVSGLVTFGGQAVSYPACGSSVWSNNEIIVEVPNIGFGNSPVAVTTGRSLTSNAINFNVINECVAGVPVPESGVPGVCSIRPAFGSILENVSIGGSNFGSLDNEPSDQVSFEGSGVRQVATLGSWTNTSVRAVVPGTAISGPVTVQADSCPSNSINFEVRTGIGTSCDGNTGVEQCQVDNNKCGLATGLYCEVSSCTCQSAPSPSVTLIEPSGDNQCRNPVIEVIFSQLMDSNSLSDTIFLEQVGDCSLGDNALNKSDSIFSYLFEVIRKPFLSLWSVAKAQDSGCLVPTLHTVVDVDVNEDGVLDSLNDETRVLLTPPVLDPGVTYHVRVLPEARSRFGIELGTELTQIFTTGDLICLIDHVDVLIQPAPQVANSDTFLCANLDDCFGDMDEFEPGNQHIWLAQARDADGNKLIADYEWVGDDPENLYILSELDTALVTVTSNYGNGDATFIAVASNPIDTTADKASTVVTVTSDICENPWPSLEDGYPYVDTDTGFGISYCRDSGDDKICSSSVGGASCSLGAICNDTDGCSCIVAGQVVCQVGQGSTSCTVACTDSEQCIVDGQSCRFDTSDDLPGLQITTQTLSEGGEIIKEFLLLREAGDISGDAIAIRVIKNLDHLSPKVWYDRFVSNPGNPRRVLIDGFEGVEEGRTMYVNAAFQTNGGIFTNIYLISHSDESDSATMAIYDQLLKRWKFTLGLRNLNVCSDVPSTFCSDDSQCINGYCRIDAVKLRRDTKRISDLGGIAESLRRYRGVCSNDLNKGCLNNDQCGGGEDETCNINSTTFPLLEAGSFDVGHTTSKWPSWDTTFGSSLDISPDIDPINKFTSCPDSYDPVACWDDISKQFSCSDGSYLYQYEVGDGGTSAALYANMEFKDVNWLGSSNLSVGSSNSCRSFSLSP